jgi:hypothetical protein
MVMKTILSILVILLISRGIYGQQITIGAGTDSQLKPFDMWYGYSRSAAVYTASEIGDSKFILSLAWEVTTGAIEISPVKIYLNLVSNATLSSTSWSSITNGATLVYDGFVSFPVAGWKTIDIADFVYIGGVNAKNLLVLCESNYGENGAQSNSPYFSYSNTYALNQHEGWQEDYVIPTGDGVLDYYRPNIQINFLPLSSPNPPSGFIANATGTAQINLAWTKNAANNNVMVAFNTVNTFGTPAGNYVAGNSIAGGGTVIYNGAASSFSHNTGLNPAITYYYKAWSVLPPAPTYSTGASASATTLCVALTGFPDTTDFETQNFPPVCWSIEQKPWTRNGSVSAFGIGNGSIYADFLSYNIPGGSFFDLISPTLNLTGMSTPVVTFDHAYATFPGGLDSLELWNSTDNGVSYSFLTSWLGGLNGPLNTGGETYDPFVPLAYQWATKSATIPSGTNKIRFRGVSGYGNNLYLDNIIIGEPMVTWNGSMSGQWNDQFNWTPNGVPQIGQDVTIPPGTPFSPFIVTTGNFCKNLLIKSDASVTVVTGSELTVMSNVVIQNNATFTNDGLVKIKGNLINQTSN